MYDNVDLTRVPQHVAIIMDGNGRWANARGLHRTQGHAAGEPALFDVIAGAREMGVKWLTAYTFSTENWSRDAFEVEFLMKFNVDLLERRRDELHADGIRIHFIGDRDDPRVPDDLRDRIAGAEALTVNNDVMHMVFAFNYGGRAEVVHAINKIAEKVAGGTLAPGDIDAVTVAHNLYLPDCPDPDLVIRTSGELRTSNYLLWEAAYSEYVFTPVLWPDFDRHTLADCIAEYQARHRRFGGAVDASDQSAPTTE
ncbi:MAG: di-trans,poly-cis-decaprenylcistransferase [bacterium]|nr:di-trans,poly-cis-decaprenylcistransferase [bacterium]MCP4967565.1 di-trans,poly-cis-decaprenylcistransferase [bacterium]